MAIRFGLRSGACTLSMVFAVDEHRWRCRPHALAMAMASAFAATGASTQTLPTGGVAVHGQAQIAKPAANQLVVTTHNGAGGRHSAIDWQSFSISAGSSVRFVQPDATSLSINRVVTQTPSAIFGSLHSNGRLVLVNPSGIAVGAGAVVDTAGFTASALRMTDADALAGRLRFGSSADAMGGGAGLTVDGRITARDGDVVLIAPQIGIGTSALVQAPNGQTILAAGQQVEITGRGLEGISLLVQARDNEARNLGRLEGDAVAIFAGTLRHSGAIQATTATLEGGQVVLRAAGDAYVEGAGSILAGGSRGGRIDVLGERVAVTDQALLDASGASKGGNIRIGGDFQGKNPGIPNADATYVGPATTVRADAGDHGDGGRVIVWADDLTKAHGHVSARGGASSGDGGFVEISGKQRLLFDGSVDLRSPNGKAGTLLLDPDYIDVSIGGGAAIGDVNLFGVNAGQSMTIAPATLDAVGGNVMLQAIEDITFNDPVMLTTPGASLTAQAGGIISVSSSSSITTNNGIIDLYANHPGAGGTGSNGSAVYVQGPLNSGGANISIRSDGSDVGGNSIHISANINAGAGAVTLDAPFDRIEQTAGAISAAALSAVSDYEITLSSVSNLITSDVNLITNTGTGSSGTITFTNSAAAYNLSGAVAKGNIQINSPGSMTTDGPIQSTTGNVSITTIGTISFGDDVSAAGTLSLTSNNGLITQSGGSSVTAFGAATINAGSGDIGLSSTLNNLSTVALTGGHITLVDANTLTVTARAQAANRNLFLQAGGILSVPAAAINTGTGQLSLISGSGNFGTPGALTGSDVLLSGAGGLSINHPVVATASLTLQSAGGSISQAGSGAGILVGGATAFNAGAFNVNLAGLGNDFASVGGTGAAVSIADTNAVVLDAINANSLNLTASGNVSQSAALIISGTTTIDAGLGVGNVTLTTPGNNLNNLNVTGNAIDVREGAGSALTVLTLASGTNQPVRLEAGHNLTLLSGPVDTGTADLALVSGNVLSSSASLDGNNISLTAVNDIQIHEQVHAGGSFSATTTVAGDMLVRSAVSADGSMTLSIAGGLSVIGDSDSSAHLLSVAGPQTITAAFVEVLASDGGIAHITNTGGVQSITTSGTNGFGEGLAVKDTSTSGGAGARIENSGSAQIITVNDADFVRIVGEGGAAKISSPGGGSQNITLQGAASQNRLVLGSPTAQDESVIFSAQGQTITAGQSGQAGGIELRGGVNDGNSSAIINNLLDQAVNTTGSITMTAGTAPGLAGGSNACHVGDNGACAFIENNGGGNQSITASGIIAIGGTSGSYNIAGIANNDPSLGQTQTITITGGGAITLEGGTSSGIANFAVLETEGRHQTIDFLAGGNLTLTGGSNGGLNFAQVSTGSGGGMQTISGASTIVLTGGISGGGAGLGNTASIQAAGSQAITVGNGGITITGGAGSLSDNAARIEQKGAAGTTQSITVNGTGSIVLTGGSALGADSDASIVTDNGDSQTITFTGGGAGRAITLTGGTNGSDAYAEIYAGTGLQTITGAGLITLTGGASGGGASFGGDTFGNLAAISADTNDQTIVASGIIVQGGAAGLNNLAGIYGGGNQSITVDSAGLSLFGGGGGGSDRKNAAILWKGSDVPGTSQTITVGGGGSITLQGGSASASNVGLDPDFDNLSNGAFAAIRSEGSAQLIEFTGSGSSIAMTGGTVGSDNHAMILALTGSQTIRGSIDAHAPDIAMTGGASGGVGGAANEGNRALIFSLAGNQTVTAHSIGLTGGAAGTENVAQIRQGDAANGLASTQNVTVAGGGDITMQGGNGNTNFARIRAFGTTQTVNFSAGGTLDMTGGSGGIDSFAQIIAHNGDQSVTGADGILLSGGSAGNNNRAQISAPLGSQTLTVGAGGLTMIGGSGGVGELANWASVYQGGTTGKSQTISVAGGGDIVVQAGDSAGTGVGLDNGSLAFINSQGDSQLIEFSAAGSSISISGGTVGSRNEAGILAFNGSQTIRGTSAANAPAISLTGGASGGAAGEGNLATIWAIAGNQTVSAGSVTLQGGASGTENRATVLADNGNQDLTAASLQLQGGAGGSSNLAQVRQGTSGTGLASTQTIRIQDGASSNIVGGGGNTNLARIQSYGTSQTLDLGSAGTLDLVGGTGSMLNFARIEAVNGSQTISGSADIGLFGGASGGAAGNGNFADIRSRGVANTQTVHAGALTIIGGTGGVDNFASIRADGDQTVSLQSSGSNALVIGSAGSVQASDIVGNNQTIVAGSGAQSGSITILGGGGVGKNAGIFANPVTPNTGTQTISTSGTLSLAGGSAAGTGSSCDPAQGGGSCGDIANSGTGLQTITANAITMQGGSAGQSNGAGIFVNGGNMLLDIGAGGLSTAGGSGGTNNFATIGGGGANGSTLTVNVAGNTLLDASNATSGSGTLIGLGGTGAGNSITIDFNGTGNLTILGSNVSPTLSGAGIGAASNQTGASATITVDAANITLNAGSQSRAAIGHKLGNGGLGDIAVNASGNIALNAVGATLDQAAAIRTGSNVTLTAGGSITQSADATIEASLLTATANGGGIVLDSVANRVGTLNATVPFFDSGDILFTNGPGMALTVSGITMAGSTTQARITADDIDITGAVSNIGGPVILRPLDLTRNVHIENSPTAGVLSLSPADLQQVTNATVLEIGRLDGTGNLGIFDNVASSSVHANRLRLLSGNDVLLTGGASIGDAGTPFAHDLELRAANNLQLTNGNIFLADNRNLQLYADNDGSTVGSANIGAGTFRVGTGAGNSTGGMDTKGAEITIAVSGGGSGLVEVLGAGSQVFTATDGDITIDNANVVTGTLTVGTDTGTQTLAAAGGIVSAVAGTGTGTSTYIRSGGNQTITAQGMFIEGRTSGAAGDGNSVWVESFGSQNVTLDFTGLTLASGGGASATKDHAAMLYQRGTTGTSQTITLNNGGSIYMEGGASTLTNVGGSGHGSRALIQSDGDVQTITLNGGGSIDLFGGTNGSRAYAQIYAATGTQTVTGASSISLNAGASGGFDGEGNIARIAANTGAQTLSAGAIALIGGASGIENSAMLFGAGGQTITANALTLTGGADGGGFSDGNRAYVGSNANQVLNIASTLLLQGGGGSLSDNAAQIEQLGMTGTQTLNLGAGASVTLLGGSSAGTNVGGTGHGSRASIYSQGTSQSLLFGANGSLTLVGGTVGSRNFAQVFAENTGSQTISGAPTIMLTGGSSGGIAGEGNSAYIGTNAGAQAISATTVTINAGSGGTENFAGIFQGNVTNGNTQSITIAAGGALTLQGGNGVGNFARVRSNGATQTLAFGAGSTLDLTGGTGASNNFARIQSVVGSQTISGNPDIVLQGGASGGADLAGNFADIRANGASALQDIAAGNLTLLAGAAGQENFAGVIGANQTITALGEVTLTGGGSATSLDGTSGGGARIGGLGGASATPTSLSLTLGGDLSITGGSIAGAALGSSLTGGQSTTIVVTAGGDIALNGGGSAAAAARIGSPSSGVGTGDIFLTAGGTITLAGMVPGESAIRTLGDVTLDASALAIGNQVAGATVFANASTSVAFSGAGQLAASALSGDSIEVVAGTSFSNSVGDTALSVAAPARWLVYSQDPALDARGGLQLAFKQYDKVFGDATPIAGTGNGFLYSIAPTASASLTGTVSKVYDGSDVATLGAGNFLVAGGIGGDVLSASSGGSATYDTKHVGSGKTVNASGVTVSALDGTVPVFGYALASNSASGAIGEITAAPLTVSAVSVNKTYDATTSAPGAVAIVTGGSLFGTDSLAGGSFAFLDPNVGVGKTVTVSGVTVNDGNGGLNYLVTQADNTTSSISAASLTLSTSDVVKTYDGTTSAAGVLVVTGGTLFGSDSVSGGSFAFTDKNAGVGNKTVTVGGAMVNDGNGGANYIVGYANNTSSTINRAGITGVTGITAANKVYDGSTSATLTTSAAGFTGQVVGDTLTVASAAGSFSDRNAGVGKTVNVSGITLGGADAGNYDLLGTSATTTATITPASITVGTSAVTKPYDGTTSAAGNAVVTGGALVGGDTLGGGSFAFLDPNVGVGKTVTVSAVTINDGNGGANYAVSFTSNTASSITALATSNWSGLGGNNLWSNPANWDVLPIGSNVLAVAIPAGAGTVVFDAAAGTTILQSLTSQQPVSVTGGSLLLGASLGAPSLNQSGGALQVGTSLTTGSLVQSAGTMQVGTTLTAGTLVQSGGSLTVGGNVGASSFSQGAGASLSGPGALVVTDNFSQAGGSVSMGSIAINQSSGNLVAANLAAASIALAAPGGSIGQTGAFNAAALSTRSATGTDLSQTANHIGSFAATNTGTGDVVLVNNGALTIGSIANQGGSIAVNNTGAIATAGPVTAPAGNVTIIANSPLTVGAGGIGAGGDIVLHATNLTSAGNLTIDGGLIAGNTILLTADNNLVQNAAVLGARGVTAAAGGTMTYGPLATTNAPPILYTAGGVPVAPPPSLLVSALQAPGDIIVTFRDLLQKAIDGPLGDLLETNPDGSKKKKDLEGVVTEGELCR